MQPKSLIVGLALLVTAVVAAATTVAAPEAAPRAIPVFFLQGEQLKSVSRPGPGTAEALQQLLAGPTKAEAKRGFRTYVPAGTAVRGLSVVDGLATVDLDGRFVFGGDTRSRLARLSQLVRTLTGLEGTTRVQLLIEGKAVSGVFPGVPTEAPITYDYLATPNVPVRRPPAPKLLPPNPHMRQVQQRLVDLGFLGKGDVDGRFGPVTANGILAFQKWERLGRTGSLDARTEARLKTASHPVPVSRGGPGKRFEILLDRQVSLLIRDNAVVRTIAVSTGKASTPTPPGDYRVYAKITRWWSVPFREWLPWAVPFVGGIAFHEFADVPAFPASHGCVRQAVAVARMTYEFAEIGLPVKVIARS
jgi:peptidoglycan hydrolase-like protein with peptidoglycan-binding domain